MCQSELCRPSSPRVSGEEREPAPGGLSASVADAGPWSTRRWTARVLSLSRQWLSGASSQASPYQPACERDLQLPDPGSCRAHSLICFNSNLSPIPTENTDPLIFRHEQQRTVWTGRKSRVSFFIAAIRSASLEKAPRFRFRFLYNI